MSKAILVMDMPKNCFDCRFQEMGFCEAVHSGGEMIPDDDLESKPCWCPLRPIPGKLELDKIRQESIEEGCYDDTNGIDEAYLQGKVSGWNACIDAIGGGDE